MSNRVRLLKPRPWFTRRTSGWSVTTRRSPGPGGLTSSPPRPKRCGAFSWIGLAIAIARSVAVDADVCKSTSKSVVHDLPDDDLLDLDEALRFAVARRSGLEPSWCDFVAFAGLTLGRSGRSHGHRTAHGRPLLGLCACVALRRR